MDNSHWLWLWLWLWLRLWPLASVQPRLSIAGDLGEYWGILGGSGDVWWSDGRVRKSTEEVVASMEECGVGVLCLARVAGPYILLQWFAGVVSALELLKLVLSEDSPVPQIPPVFFFLSLSLSVSISFLFFLFSY